jgi:hypothetical protein
LLPCAQVGALYAAKAPASSGRHARLDGRRSAHSLNSLIVPNPGFDFVWRARF